MHLLHLGNHGPVRTKVQNVLPLQFQNLNIKKKRRTHLPRQTETRSSAAAAAGFADICASNRRRAAKRLLGTRPVINVVIRLMQISRCTRLARRHTHTRADVLVRPIGFWKTTESLEGIARRGAI